MAEAARVLCLIPVFPLPAAAVLWYHEKNGGMGERPVLRFLLGRAGSGKTCEVRNMLKNMAGSGGSRLMLLVPEQASFENERAMLRLLGAKDARRVSVTSFSRLVDLVQRECGGFAGRRLDDGGRGMFLSLALEQVKDRLRIYRKNAEGTELVGPLLGVLAEFKMCDVGPKSLEEAALRLPDGSLRRKTEEISWIFSAYDALVAQSFVDPLDDLTRLKRILQEHPLFEGYTVMIDSFQSFTVQEYDIIGQILRQAEDVWITLCADSLGGEEDSGLFSIARKTARVLTRIAVRAGVPVASPAVLQPGGRFKAPALAALEAGVYRPLHKAFQGEKDGAVLYEAKNRYDEAAFVSAAIRNLVMEGRYRYRDFAVIARSTDVYNGILDSALESREIPFFMDRPEAIDAEPLMRLVLSAFRIAESGFRSDDVFLYLKTGLAGLSTEQISELENYTFVWNISGRRWTQEWTENPEGFAAGIDESGAALLRRVNESRRAAVSPLLRFEKDTEDADGEGMAAAVYRLLQAVGAAENLRSFAAGISAGGDPQLAERELRLWDLMMQILDQLALVVGKNRIARARCAELLRLVVRSSRMADIPQGLDEVTVGDADRIRAAGPKVVFLIGAVQGEFPMAPGSDSIFSDAERRELIGLGLPLNDTAEGVALQERFLAYSAVSAASERLYVTYPIADGEGHALAPSSIPSEVSAVLGGLSPLAEEMMEETFFADAEAPALELAARRWNDGSVLSSTLRKLLGGREAARMAAVSRAALRTPARFADPEISGRLFGRSMTVSATQIEKFELCRFQYFCRYGLNVRERRAAELNALEYGSLMHFLLQRLFQDIGSSRVAGMAPEELHKMILEILGEYVRLMFGGMEDETPRFAYLVSRIADSAQIVAAHIAQELSQSGFSPADFELPIGGAVGPLVIPLPDGGEVRVDGKIDRVDLMDRGGVRYLRIVDYKTGKREFRFSDLVYGMNMQMLIYLAALCENGRERYGGFRPAGVLYMPADAPGVPAERSASSADLRGELEKRLRMDGIVLDQPDVIAGMDREADGRYIPVGLKNGAPSGRKNIYSAEEMKQILAYLRTLIAQMVTELHKGDVAAFPLHGSRYDACEWCPYASVCGHERDGPAREMQDWDRNAALRELEAAKKEGADE